MPIVKNGLKSTKTLPKCSSAFAMNTSISDIIADVYDFPYSCTVPLGDYTATINDILDTKTHKGKQAIDVLYDLKDSDDNVYNIRLRYPIKSNPIMALTKRWVAEGLVKEYLSEAVNATENITITYKDEDSIGEITTRQNSKSTTSVRKGTLGSRNRKTAPAPLPAPVQDEDEDLLDEDEDEEDSEEDDLSEFLDDEE